MKRNIIILLLLYSMSILSQNLSVYGVSLGEKKYIVENILVGKGKTIKYDKTDDGRVFLRIDSPILGEVKYGFANFYIDKNNLVNKIIFVLHGDAGLGAPNGPWASGFRQQSIACERAFITMFGTLKMKYGEPNIESKNNIVWIKKNQRISLEWTYRYDKDAMGWIIFDVRTALVYEKIDVHSSDF